MSTLPDKNVIAEWGGELISKFERRIPQALDIKCFVTEPVNDLSFGYTWISIWLPL